MYGMAAWVGLAFCLGLLPMAAPAFGAGDYIVVLKDGFSPTRAARRHGAVPTFVYHYALLGYAATLSDAALARAQADPSVAYVVPDQPVWALQAPGGPACSAPTPASSTPTAPLPPVSEIVPQE